MKIKRVVVGDLQENCYILEKENHAIIIDPGAEKEKIEKELEGLIVEGILLTHSHFDHIGALSYFEEKYQIHHNDEINFFDYEVISTPGHSKDSLSFYFPEMKIMFTGDFLFAGTIGRMDFPGGSEIDMKESLEKISKYPDDIVIYPGHGEKSLLGEEKKYFKFYI